MLVKGKAEALARIAITGAGSTPPASAGKLDLLQGRELELARLLQLVTSSRARRMPHSALITGEAGSGKTALIAALGFACRGEGVTVAGGTVAGMLEPRAYRAWAPVMASLVGSRVGESAQTSRERVRNALAGLLGDEAEWSPLIDGLLGLPAPAVWKYQGLDSQTRRRRLHMLVERLLAAKAARAPLLVILDPLDPEDVESPALFDYLAHSVIAAPLLLVAAARAEPVGLRCDVHLALNGLSVTGIAAIARAITGAAEVDDAVLNWLQQKTRGNPLFVDALTRAAVAAHSLEVSPGSRTCVAVADLETLPVPENVQPLLLGQVDRLPAADRRAVQAAAVCGGRITTAMLARLVPALPRARSSDSADQTRLRGGGHGTSTPLEDDAATFAVRHLELREIFSVPEPDGSVRFARPLLRETVYASLSTPRRRALHLRLAQMVDLYPGSDEQRLEFAAYHYVRAQDRRMIDAALLAANNARMQGDGFSALRLYQAICAAPRSILRGRTEAHCAALLAIADVEHNLLSRYADALAPSRQALRVSRRLAGRVRRTVEAGASLRLGRSYRRLGNDKAAIRWLHRSLRSFGDASTPERIDVHLELSMCAYLRGRMRPALSECDDALDQARLLGDDRRLAQALDRRGVILSGIGEHAAAAASLEESVSLCERLEDLFSEASARINLGSSYFWLGRWSEARETYAAARALEKRLGDIDRTLQASLNLAEVIGSQGDIEEALALCAECQAAWKRSGFQLGVAHAHLFAGETLARAGRFDDAVAELEAAFTIFSQLHLDGLACHAAAARAEALADGGRHREASLSANEAEALALRVRSPMYNAYAQRAVGVAAGSGELAVAVLRRAAAGMAAAGMRYEEARTRVRLARTLLAGNGETSAGEALGLLNAAAATFVALGARLDSAAAEALRSSLSPSGSE